jgi:uncharacterized surface protein with fasciclin (FAS1) repeats
MIRTLLAATAAAFIVVPAVQAQEQNIAEAAMANPELSTLVEAVKAAGLAETLQGEGPFTVFAPTNAAFEALPAGTLEDLLKPENKDKLAQILSYHVIQGDEVTSSEITGEMTPATVQGANLDIMAQDGKVMVEEATVVTPDVEASNGVVHLIDKVLIPEGVM